MYNVRAHPYNNSYHLYDSYRPCIHNEPHMHDFHQEIDIMVESFVRNNYAPTTLPIKTLISPKPKARRSSIPRPLNSFLIYRRDYQARLSKEAGRKLPIVSKKAGELWRCETDEVRNRYEKIADLAGEFHKILYPNYEYKPNKNKRKRSARPKMTEQDQYGLQGAPSMISPPMNIQVPLSFEDVDKNMCRVLRGPN
ncbi:12896_t:CDS:1 [Funneliformis caledonium]|uniref:12896_t:CDS:1 n=1 Tax=Funneliformis caledonium TaxID=1117310 RepID=A0A9N9GSY2_9GLOM|nr:12896_t:CDS:1 [Funneliformis caledonium]